MPAKRISSKRRSRQLLHLQGAGSSEGAVWARVSPCAKMGLCSSQPWDQHLYLRQTPLFGALQNEEIEAVAAAFRLVEFQDGAVIVEKGSPSTSAFSIVSGEGYFQLRDSGEEGGGSGSPRVPGAPIPKGAFVQVSAGSFFGGFSLAPGADSKDSKGGGGVVKEPLSVVARGSGSYVELTRGSLASLRRRAPAIAKKIEQLLELRRAVLRVPLLRHATASWDQESKLALASLFAYQSWTDEDYVLEKGVAAQGLTLVMSGSIERLRGVVGSGQERVERVRGGDGPRSVLNLTALFYKHGRTVEDVVTVGDGGDDSTGGLTQAMSLARDDFRAFCDAGGKRRLADVKRAAVRMLLGELRAEGRLFLPLVEEKEMDKFAELWSLREYGENVRIATRTPASAVFDRNAAGTAGVEGAGGNGGGDIPLDDREAALFHVIVAGSADAYSNETKRAVTNERHILSAHRQTFEPGSSIGALSPRMMQQQSQLTIVSGQSRCLVLTLDEEAFKNFFRGKQNYDDAMRLVEQHAANAANNARKKRGSGTSGAKKRSQPRRLNLSVSHVSESKLSAIMAPTGSGPDTSADEGDDMEDSIPDLRKSSRKPLS